MAQPRKLDLTPFYRHARRRKLIVVTATILAGVAAILVPMLMQRYTARVVSVQAVGDKTYVYWVRAGRVWAEELRDGHRAPDPR